MDEWQAEWNGITSSIQKSIDCKVKILKNNRAIFIDNFSLFKI